MGIGVVLARRSSDHLAVRLLIVLTSPHSYRSPVDRVPGLSAPAPAKRAIAKRFRALARPLPPWSRDGAAAFREHYCRASSEVARQFVTLLCHRWPKLAAAHSIAANDVVGCEP